MPEPFVRIRNVSKTFGSVAAVDDVSLDIGRGEFYALLGPSGCGKTTLLRMLAGLEIPTAGDIEIDGADVTAVPAYRRPVNMVFQNYAIFPHLDVRANIAFGLRKDRLSHDELSRRVDEALALIRLEGYGARRAHELSGGQRQRVALARALVKRPKVLLLDEPLGALDKNLREAMQLELLDLQRNVGVTFVLVTHDQEEAMTMSDRIAVMSGGKLVEAGPPRALYTRPQTCFAASFLGSINLIPGTVERVTPDAVAVTTAAGRALAAGGKGFQPGDAVLVAVRPENLSVTAPDRPAISIAGVVAHAVWLGDRAHIHVRAAGLATSLQATVLAASDAARLQPGDAVMLHARADDLLLFAAKG
jgi:spermidine/putrescine ABC transporter ATP-binding subunit